MISRHTFGLVLALALGWGHPSALAVDWNGMIISEIASDEMEAEERQALIKALDLEVGKPLDADRLSESIREMGNSGKWMRVFVDGVATGRKLKLSVRGVRVRKLRKLDFAEIDAEVLDEVKDKARADHDQTADAESFSGLRQLIKEAYQQRGFFRAQVTFSTRVLGPEEADVEVKVSAGPPTRISKLAVRGGPEEENATMRDLIPLEVGDTFSRLQLNVGIEKINAYLKANQFPTSRVLDSSLQFSTDMSEVDVTVILKMGERFQIQFSGNSVFDSVQLRGLLTEDVLAQSDPSGRIAQLVESKYRSVGYPDCVVQVKKTTVGDAKLTLIQLEIHEGTRARIQDLRFSCGDEVAGIDLESLFYESAPGVLQRHLYWFDGLAEAVGTMQARLRAMGYLNSRIAEPKATFSEDREEVVLFFDADVGVQTILTRIEFVGLKSFAYSDLVPHFTLQIGAPLNRDQVPETATRILAFLADSGFPNAKLTKPLDTAVEVSLDQQSAVVRYEIDEGMKYHIGTIQIEGLRKTKAKVVLRELGFESGSLYSAREIRLAEENLGLLGLFSRTEIVETPNEAKSDQMDIRILVRETRPGIGELGFGGVYEEPRLRLRPFVGLAYRNVSGLNQTASVRGDLGLPISRQNGQLQVPFVEYSSVVGYRYPYFLELPLTLASQVAFDRVEVQPVEQTILTRARIEARLEKKFSPRVTGIYRLIRVERTTTQSFIPVTSTATTESIGSTGPGIILDLRDDIFNPTRGSFHSLDIELAHPVLFSQTGISFVLGLWRNSFYVPVSRSINLAFSLGLGYARSLLSSALPTARLVNELSLGGQGSIRGIGPRALSPSEFNPQQMSFYNGRVELSTKLFEDFGVAVFFDTGQIFPDSHSVPRADGVGVGLRYKTPVGPVVIDFAQGLGALRDTVKFYFTVGTI